MAGPCSIASNQLGALPCQRKPWNHSVALTRHHINGKIPCFRHTSRHSTDSPRSCLSRLPSCPTSLKPIACFKLESISTHMAPAQQHTGKQGKTSSYPNIQPGTIVEGPEAWYASNYPGDLTQYAYTFTTDDLAELEAAMASVVARGLQTKDVRQEDFLLPTLGPKLKAIQRDVTWGRGFALLRGLPVWRYTRAESLLAYWGIGLYWGKAGSNNKKGHLIGHIKDIGGDASNPSTRLYTTNAAQPWHNDVADLVSLLCLKAAKSGGHSSWASSITVHNEIVKRAPELAQVLAEPIWYYDRKGEIPPGKLPYFLIPVFNYHKGALMINFSSNYYYASQRYPEVPRLTPEQHAAIQLFEAIAASPEVALHYILQPGDIQLLNNHTCLHHRTAFEDYEDINERRHLLRLWLSPSDERELPPVYEDLYGGSLTVGDRGCVRADVGQEEHITEEAE